MSYETHICGVSLRGPVSWDRVIFYRRFDAAIINECEPAGMFSVFQIEIPTFEPNGPLINSDLSYGTISVNIQRFFFCSQNEGT